MIEVYSSATEFPGAHSRFWAVSSGDCPSFPTTHELQQFLQRGAFPLHNATMRGGRVYTAVDYGDLISDVCQM